MATLRFDPWRDPFLELDRFANQMVSGTRVPALMPMDAYRSGDAYHVLLDLPGVDPGSVEITVDDATLTIRAERAASIGEGDEVIVAERPQGSFSRQLMLGQGLDTEQVQADYHDGVLHLLIPMAATAQPRRVQVSQGARGGTQIGAGGTGNDGAAGQGSGQVIDVGESTPASSSTG